MTTPRTSVSPLTPSPAASITAGADESKAASTTGTSTESKTITMAISKGTVEPTRVEPTRIESKDEASPYFFSFFYDHDLTLTTYHCHYGFSNSMSPDQINGNVKTGLGKTFNAISAQGFYLAISTLNTNQALLRAHYKAAGVHCAETIPINQNQKPLDIMSYIQTYLTQPHDKKLVLFYFDDDQDHALQAATVFLRHGFDPSKVEFLPLLVEKKSVRTAGGSYEMSSDVSHFELSHRIATATPEGIEKLLADVRTRADLSKIWKQARSIIELEKVVERAAAEEHRQASNLVLSYYKIHQALYEGEETIWKKTSVLATPSTDELKNPSESLSTIKTRTTRAPTSRSAHALKLAEKYSRITAAALADNKSLVKEIHDLSYAKSGLFAKHPNVDEPKNRRTQKIIQALRAV